MDDYTKALKIQELREQRVDLMWEYIITEISLLDSPENLRIKNKICELHNHITQLQNG